MGLPPRVNEKVSSFKSNTGWTSRGENSSVLKKLGSIEFVDGTFGGMTPAVAYIQYWSREGVARRRLEEAARDILTPPTDKILELTKEFEGAFKQPVSETNINYFDPDLLESSNLKLPRIPENLKIAAFRTPTDPKEGTEDTNVLPSEPFAGGIYGANPVSNYTDMETSAVWTFMFNPEELELSSGPDYNRAEAWGVSDPFNEGQPLSWRANKNRKLSFGKILLHGYSLGKRVDSLEKGLQDLFMARDGENGADGPPVLEFVWGRRVFGPCVIQDIKVREKAWDAGYLVNAEVSFTLEQVPEWTINDGFVDVLRPGRQPTLSDPTVSSRDYRDTSTPETDTEPKPEPDLSPGPKDVKDCTTLSEYRQSVNDDIYELERLKGKPLRVITKAGGLQGTPISNDKQITRLWARGLRLPPLDSSSEVIKKVEEISSSPVCNIDNNKDGYEEALNQAYASGSDVTKKIKNIDNYYTDRAISCLKQSKTIYSREFSSRKCSDSPYRTPRGKRQGPGLFD
jgi:hypothetical protein